MFCFFLLFHFLSYTLFLKKYLFSEKAIIFYHLISVIVAIIFSYVSYVNMGYSLSQCSVKIGLILGIQGIYSLTFLEIWSLTEGSYALIILAKLYNAKVNHTATNFCELERVGLTKQVNRISHLVSLKLISQVDEKIRLTLLGAAVVYLLNIVNRLAVTKIRE